MNLEYIAKCTRCDFSVELYPNNYNYRYPGIRILPFPKISYSWCRDCNKFVPIQNGINLEEIRSLQSKLYHDLLNLEVLYIKSKAQKEKIQSLKNQLKETIALEALIDNHSTEATCIECGGNNLVYKDIEHQIWGCPKCRFGFLKLHQENNDIFYRKCDKIIYPQLTRRNYEQTLLVHRIVFCCIDLINNEGIYYRLSKNSDNINSLTKTTSFIDRTCLIYSVLSQLFKMSISKEEFAIDIIDYLVSSDIISNETKDFFANRFNERIKYFKAEIELEQNCSAFIPTAIIKTLREPEKEPTHNIVGIDVIDAMQHWKVIIDTISAYFAS